MDPTTAILSALSLAGAAAQPVADEAVKDGYASLKALILRRFGSTHPKLEQTLADYEDDPETYAKPAAKVLGEADVATDQEIVGRAFELLRRAEGAGISVTASGEGSVAIGGSVSSSTIITGGGQPKVPPAS